jgi:hypothetical protein
MGRDEIIQAIRYYLKNQKFPCWDDMDEYQKGVTVACENIEQLIDDIYFK